MEIFIPGYLAYLWLLKIAVRHKLNFSHEPSKVQFPYCLAIPVRFRKLLHMPNTTNILKIHHNFKTNFLCQIVPVAFS